MTSRRPWRREGVHGHIILPRPFSCMHILTQAEEITQKDETNIQVNRKPLRNTTLFVAKEAARAVAPGSPI
jgi:hypothetical protein